ncbi:MAG TPA: DNA repair protein RecN [Acidimicrobiales bacterium]|nr:DNA repair protein RecN [Acidimicrobiales bacterium]
MLTDLRVRDLGVIEDLTLTFGPGMTALTGETGAGKTLVVEALQLVLGGRANPGMVRAGAAEALVEARFVVARDAGADGADGADGPEREVILARSVPAEGRSKAWVDGRMAPVSALAETASDLVEVHGQHEHRALVTATAQRNVLDTFAGTDLRAVRALRDERHVLDDALAALGGDVQQRAREADVLRYQVGEIGAAHLEDPHEEAGLRLEEDGLADAAAYREAASGAAELLDPAGGEGGAIEPLGAAVSALSGREAFEEHRARLAGAAVELSDVARALRDQAEGWEDDPQRLAEVQERRRLLGELRRKYGEDLAAVMAYASEAATRLAVLEDAEGEAARLADRLSALGEELAEAETVVRTVRLEAAGDFGRRVEEHLGDLAMAGARLEVRLGADGAGEPVELLLGANVGEPVQPLARAASGGELARAMLAIRLVGLGGPQTMVFDEVDAGVGGAAALALGEALHEVAAQRQVLVVTHLAQVASRADAQISVVKHESGGRTVTVASTVAGEERVTELSRMLSGHPGSDAARAHARELLEVGGA